MHDIYDPPPAPAVELGSPRAERLVFTRADVACLAALCLGLLACAFLFWNEEPALAITSAGAGALVVLESWLTALGFLHRNPPVNLKARWSIFLAALLPWLIGLGLAVSLLLGLFWMADYLRS